MYMCISSCSLTRQLSRHSLCLSLITATVFCFICLFLILLLLFPLYSYSYYRFDVDNNASVNEQEFVQGWFDLSKSEGHGDYLYNIKKLVGEDNILL